MRFCILDAKRLISLSKNDRNKSRNSFRSSENKDNGSEVRAIMKEEHWNLGRTRDKNENGGKPTKDTLIWWDPLNFVWDP